MLFCSFEHSLFTFFIPYKLSKYNLIKTHFHNLKIHMSYAQFDFKLQGDLDLRWAPIPEQRFKSNSM